MADPAYFVAMSGRLLPVYPSPPVSDDDVDEVRYENSGANSSSATTLVDDPPLAPTNVPANNQYPIPPANQWDGETNSSESSDGSYTAEELQMGLVFYRQSDQAITSYPYNPDGTWEFSPAVFDQIALLGNNGLSEVEIDMELDVLQYLIEADVETNSPKESAIDLAEAIEDGRFNPWDTTLPELTCVDRVMLWKAMSPYRMNLGKPQIGHVKEDSRMCACRTDIGTGRNGNEAPCLGDFCALVKEGSSESQVGRALELHGLRAKCEAMMSMIRERDGVDETEELLDGEDDEVVERVEVGEQATEGFEYEEYFDEYEASLWYDERTDEWYYC